MRQTFRVSGGRGGGFTLIELLISVTILALAILTYLVVDVENRRTNIVAQEVTIAENQMAQKIEEVKELSEEAGNTSTVDLFSYLTSSPRNVDGDSPWTGSPPNSAVTGLDPELDSPAAWLCESAHSVTPTAANRWVMHIDVIKMPNTAANGELVEVQVKCRWTSRAYGKIRGRQRGVEKTMKTKISDPTPSGS